MTREVDFVWSGQLVHILDPSKMYSVGHIHTGTFCGKWRYCLHWRKAENFSHMEMCAECQAKVKDLSLNSNEQR